MLVQSPAKKIINRRIAGNNIWLGYSESDAKIVADQSAFKYEVLPTEAAVGQAMFDELAAYAKKKTRRHCHHSAWRARRAGDVSNHQSTFADR